MAPVDDALDRLAEVFGPRVPAKHASYLERVRNERIADLATVRSALEQLREERDELLARDEAHKLAGELAVSRYETAEAELARYREGLREAETAFSDISLILEAENEGYQERVYRRAVEEWRHARALLAASPDGANTEGGEA